MKSTLQTDFSLSGSLKAGDQLTDNHVFMGTTVLGNPIGSRSEFSSSGSLRMVSGSMWQLIYVDASNLRQIPNVSPDWEDPVNSGYEFPAFPAGVGKRINFSISIPSSLKTTSNQNSLSIYVQLNIIYNENMAGEEGQYSKWRFEYKLLGNGDSYSGYTILYKDIYYEEQNSGTYFVHGYNNDGFILNNIDLSVGKTLMCMLTRIGTADTYADKVYLSGINFAIPIDSIGSDFTNSKIVI